MASPQVDYLSHQQLQPQQYHPRSRSKAFQHLRQDSYHYQTVTSQPFSPVQAEVETWRQSSSFQDGVSKNSTRRLYSPSREPHTSPSRSSSDGSSGLKYYWNGSAARFDKSTPRRKSTASNTSSNNDPRALYTNGTLSKQRGRSPAPQHSRSANRSASLTIEPSTRTNGRTSHPNYSNGNGTGRGCKYETALVNSRRRIPYSLGVDALPRVLREDIIWKLEGKAERCLEQDIMDLYHALLPTEDTEERRKRFVEKLQCIFDNAFTGKKLIVRVFGSSENKLCTNTSDVDVCLDTNAKELEDTCFLANVLAENNMKDVICVAAAKVPVVKIYDAELKIHCDINVNNSLAIENTRMVKTYIDIDPRVRPLAMIIKYWAKQRVLNDAAGGGTLTSYTWILMVINFLQIRDPPILPSLHRLPHQKRVNGQGVDVGFFDDIGSLTDFGEGNKNTESLGALLYGFFLRFAFEFDYDKDVISVREGGTLSKESKGWHLMQNNSLCVEEPFNTTRNLGNTADEATVKGLQVEFRRAVHFLADHTALEGFAQPYHFPSMENPRPERHLPWGNSSGYGNGSWRGKPSKLKATKKEVSPLRGSSPRRMENGQRGLGIGAYQSHHGRGGSFSHFNAGLASAGLASLSTPQLTMAGNLPATPHSIISPTEPHHGHGFAATTPLTDLHFVDPYRTQGVKYYIPAFAPSGLPVYMSYGCGPEEAPLYGSPPQTPAAMNDIALHGPTSAGFSGSSAGQHRSASFVVPQYYSQRGQSMSRGRPGYRQQDMRNQDPLFVQGNQHASNGVRSDIVAQNVMINGASYAGQYGVYQAPKRRNSLPPNNRPNLLARSRSAQNFEQDELLSRMGSSTQYTGSPVLPGTIGIMNGVGAGDAGQSSLYTDGLSDGYPEEFEYEERMGSTNGVPLDSENGSMGKASPVTSQSLTLKNGTNTNGIRRPDYVSVESPVSVEKDSNGTGRPGNTTAGLTIDIIPAAPPIKSYASVLSAPPSANSLKQAPHSPMGFNSSVQKKEHDFPSMGFSHTHKDTFLKGSQNRFLNSGRSKRFEQSHASQLGHEFNNEYRGLSEMQKSTSRASSRSAKSAEGYRKFTNWNNTYHQIQSNIQYIAHASEPNSPDTKLEGSYHRRHSSVSLKSNVSAGRKSQGARGNGEGGGEPWRGFKQNSAPTLVYDDAKSSTSETSSSAKKRTKKRISKKKNGVVGNHDVDGSGPNSLTSGNVKKHSLMSSSGTPFATHSPQIRLGG